MKKQKARRRFHRPVLERLEHRDLFAFLVDSADIFGSGSLRLVADFSQAVNASTVQSSDVVIDGTQSPISFRIVDADTVEFSLPTLSTGSHTITIAAGAIRDSLGYGLEAFIESYVTDNPAQFQIKQNPRLQLGNAPLVGFAGSQLDRVDILWQTIPGGAGTMDAFTVEYRPVGSIAAWQSVPLNASIATGVENRVVWSATITGLNWNSDYAYRVRHRRADVIVNQYEGNFHTRLVAGDQTPFSFAAYGDSASGSASGFRQVQGRINQNNPAFSVLLGDNVYESGTHKESDARLDPLINPEAAAWMAGHIDYLGFGNHDIATSSGLPSEQNYSVPIPVAGVTAPASLPASERPEHNFSWDYGDVHFVTFDTNSATNTTRLNNLLNWVVADLNASTARWKIVYGHHPLAGLPNMSVSPGDTYYQQVVSRLKAAGADMFMVGHSHAYSWSYPLTGNVGSSATFVNHGDYNRFLGGEGLVQLVSGAGGVGLNSGSYGSFPFIAKGFSTTTAIRARFGYSHISVTPNELKVDYVAGDNGQIIDSFTITKEPELPTAIFQQGVNGYAAAVDTFLQQNAPTTNNATATTLKVDTDDPTGSTKVVQSLLRFDNLFGSVAGQVPVNATMQSATLQLQVTNGGNSLKIHRMLSDWTDTDTWNSFTGGVQIDDVESRSGQDASSFGAVATGVLSVDVLASLKAWQASPSSNHGWLILSTGADDVVFQSSEGTSRPRLIVTYKLNPVRNDPPIAAHDVVTTEINTPAVIPVLDNDSDPNGHALTIVSTTVPAHGTAVVNAGNTITYSPTVGFSGDDSFSYTISDGGVETTALVTVAVLKKLIFQQGLSGYAASVDTFFEQNEPTEENSTNPAIEVDGDEPSGSGLQVQGLLRFDDLFGVGPARIAAGDSLRSAKLKLHVTDSGDGLTLHRLLVDWQRTSTWDSWIGGVQSDGFEAIMSPDASTASIDEGVVTIDVLTSLQAWLADPTTNHGWVILPTGTNGVELDASEGTIPPSLVVTLIPAPNRAPTAGNDGATTREDTPVSISVLTNDNDPNGDTLSVTSASTAAHGTVAIVGGTTITYTPAANYFGNDRFTYSVSDGFGVAATGTVDLTIDAVNDPPVATNDSATASSMAPVNINVRSNDSDVEGNLLTVSLVTGPRNGSALLNIAGTVTYTANVGFAGTDTFSYLVNDGTENSNIATVTVSVTPAAKFIVVDNSSDKTFQYRQDGSFVSLAALSSGNTNARGVASNLDGSRLWVLDSNKKVYVYGANMTLLGTWSPSGLKSPTGIAVSGSDVWIVDGSTDRVYRFAGETARLTGTVVATQSFKLNFANGSPQDLATDGTTVWVTQSGLPDRVFVYQTSTGLNLGNWTIDPKNTSPKGIAIDPTNSTSTLWIVDDSKDRVFEYPNARTLLAGSQLASTSFALNSGNRNPQGIVDPVSASARAKLANSLVSVWSNPANPLDVNGNGSVEPLDVLAVINELNSPRFHDVLGNLVNAADLTIFPGQYYDAHSDGIASPLDALVVVNFLNSRARLSSEGEAGSSEFLETEETPPLILQADVTEQNAADSGHSRNMSRPNRELAQALASMPATQSTAQPTSPKSLTGAERAVHDRALEELLCEMESLDRESEWTSR